ncbi:MAG: type II toxin-antitoxin system mRNA interferase toxin, RelE/StbE family [Zetaproteobacteria bacterium CG_4_9_14_3_um_filter_49_83]|nr:MAG: addiction module toxin RelE [Zetaproteobacteria bacterium CG1_02_49_23]PIQ34236.1 MAG: type II toxin-antitoxin system mRNA interferase toxin, RelE/StbE family [Zetaproteobacteria bacterium CG17_big_fil_post_rev_8_21_14_2_50_50_13]PIY57155.1 MAG: type II toxin-antitoxin system mRNA interferase toxin, RelE/StbE family [Zetaproteobacteria bacterium CG_4_10_14_0_8_um_filter_49_80]PJA33939.1 MAG: type II toxin-antitoxin system mRNA interferase toxin, RelE/StbE family [Zetaproteobacteria bacte
MTYKLEFIVEALKEWKALDATIQKQFKKKLAERLQAPEVPAARLLGSTNRYKIKLRSAGFRLVYEVYQQEVLVLVVAVGKRERNNVYKAAAKRELE